MFLYCSPLEVTTIFACVLFVKKLVFKFNSESVFADYVVLWGYLRWPVSVIHFFPVYLPKFVQYYRYQIIYAPNF